jgi:uncharacterized protein YjbJ (UPF0337 family)
VTLPVNFLRAARAKLRVRRDCAARAQALPDPNPELWRLFASLAQLALEHRGRMSRSRRTDWTLRVAGGKKENDMDWNRVEGNWKQLKGKIKEKWGELTDDDLDKLAGNREQFEGKIQERYGIGKDQAKRNIDDWLKNLQ